MNNYAVRQISYVGDRVNVCVYVRARERYTRARVYTFLSQPPAPTLYNITCSTPSGRSSGPPSTAGPKPNPRPGPLSILARTGSAGPARSRLDPDRLSHSQPGGRGAGGGGSRRPRAGRDEGRALSDTLSLSRSFLPVERQSKTSCLPACHSVGYLFRPVGYVCLSVGYVLAP